MTERRSATIQGKALLRPLPILCARDVSADEYLERLGVASGGLEDPEVRVPVDTLAQAWDLAEELSGDPQIALRAVAASKPTYFGLPGHILANSRDVETGLERVLRYVPLWTDGLRLELVRSAGDVEVRQTFVSPRHATLHLNVLFCGTIYQLLRGLTGNEFRLKRAGFVHPKPKARAPYTELFHCPVDFDQRHNFISFDERLHKLGFPHADAFLSRELTKIADDVLAKLQSGDGFTERVTHAVVSALDRGDATVQAVSHTLAVSPRTLQRKLRQLGMSFQTLLDQVRSELAEQYLRHSSLGIDEVGFMLGYAERRAFDRAFQRWTGTTPGQFVRSRR